MLVGATNFAVLLFIALSTQLLHLMKTFGQELNIRPNHQLMEALSTVQFGSAVANLLIFLFLCFTAFSMRDAFDRALLVRKRAIYATDAMQMSEASSGSYLFHIALMLTTLILSFFFLIPPAPRQQVTEIEFVQPDEKTHEKLESKKRSTENSKLQRDPNITRTSVDAQQSSATNRPQAPRRTEPTRPQERRVTTRQEEPSPRQQEPARTTPAPEQAHTPPAPASNTQTPTPPRPVPIQRTGGSMVPAPLSVQPPAAVSHIAPTPQPQSRMPAIPTIPNLSSLVPMSATSSKTATITPGPKAVNVGQSPPRGIMISDKSGQVHSVQPGIEEIHTQQTGSTRGPVALKAPSGSDRIGEGIAPPTPGNGGARRSISSIGPIGKPDLPDSSGTNSPGPNSSTGGKNQTAANPEEGLRKGTPSNGCVPDVDFSKFMADLQRRIKQAWFPPKDTESLRIKVQFVAHKNGSMGNLRLIKSSGNALADQAALRAVQNAAPFKPLPEGAPPSVDIEFTFDYNVYRGGFGGSRLRNW